MSCSGGGGMRDSLAGGSIHLAMGTYGVARDPDSCRSPCEGGTGAGRRSSTGAPGPAAASGQLGIVAAGPQESVKRCEPLLALIGRRTFRVRMKPETATAIKLANNMVLGAVIVAQAEAGAALVGIGIAEEQPVLLFQAR